MFTEERYQHILNQLKKDGKVLVKDLSREFNISESMIRKDLQALERKNLLQRTYGGAINLTHTLVTTESFQKRTKISTEPKEIVAKKAVAHIQEGNTIFLDASTISFLIVKIILELNIKVTIITNMYEIASLISDTSKINFIFIGGEYNPYVGGCIGSYSIQQIKGYRCNKAFIGCVGVDLTDGSVSTAFTEDACTKQAIMAISKELYLLMFNLKFEINGSFTFSELSDYNAIITESQPSDNILELLQDYEATLL